MGTQVLLQLSGIVPDLLTHLVGVGQQVAATPPPAFLTPGWRGGLQQCQLL